MIEAIASFDGRIAKVQGPARSGKTEALDALFHVLGICAGAYHAGEITLHVRQKHWHT